MQRIPAILLATLAAAGVQADANTEWTFNYTVSGARDARPQVHGDQKELYFQFRSSVKPGVFTSEDCSGKARTVKPDVRGPYLVIQNPERQVRVATNKGLVKVTDDYRCEFFVPAVRTAPVSKAVKPVVEKRLVATANPVPVKSVVIAKEAPQVHAQSTPVPEDFGHVKGSPIDSAQDKSEPEPEPAKPFGKAQVKPDSNEKQSAITLTAAKAEPVMISEPPPEIKPTAKPVRVSKEPPVPVKAKATNRSAAVDDVIDPFADLRAKPDSDGKPVAVARKAEPVKISEPMPEVKPEIKPVAKTVPAQAKADVVPEKPAPTHNLEVRSGDSLRAALAKALGKWNMHLSWNLGRDRLSTRDFAFSGGSPDVVIDQALKAFELKGWITEDNQTLYIVKESE
ncbi:MAG: hypothetical protein A2286_03980 [Gammaproteobacteria bacterium RIFOXYA12_FULL_61_12]|nr:MAG: hypothetical protein A2514_14515 [Gammaproteobacteria bacterium RIFOXYD12_FULL_61_37]OGT94457.1 MAG: hypothetical protein A2286_03980 [Gammaproteobacteria bacterium RIFOXYA12_FULL_61_12]